MKLHTQIKEELKTAMKEKDELRRRVLRDILSAFTNRLVSDNKKPDEILGDDAALEVINKLAKQRKDSIEQFEKGGRDDLVDQEKEELAVLEEYLPEQLSKEEIREIVVAKKDELGIEDASGFGQLMGAVMSEVGTQADGDTVKDIVNEVLS